MLVGGNMRRRLIDFRARGQHQRSDVLAATGVDHIDHALDADIEHQFGRAVEKFGAVDEGEVMNLAARPLWVDRLVVLSRPDMDRVELEMVCGKGGYVRSIARDLGESLGCLGHAQWLHRSWSGPFHADQGVTLDLIDAEAKTDALDAHLLPLEIGLTSLPEFPATPEGAARLRNGNPGMVIASAPWGTEGWASLNGQAIAVGHYRAGELHPSRVFNR